MKKNAKGSKTKKSAAPRAAAKKPASRPAAAKQAAPKPGPARPVAAPETPRASDARYTPPPLRADGWGPCRDPPQ